MAEEMQPAAGQSPLGGARLPDRVREGCAWVAARARSVEIRHKALEAYAVALAGSVAALEADQVTEPLGADPATEIATADGEARTAFAVCLDAINFGSGWWPTIRRRAGLSGYSTVAAGLAERFRSAGAWSADELSEIEAAEVAAALGQDPEHPLMAQFATSLRDVGVHVRDDHGARFGALLEAAGGSAVALAERLAAWRAFADASEYGGRSIPFFKRAQIAAADVARMGLANFDDLGRLTAFADNLVPHVLRVDGVLRLAPAFEAKIEAGKLLEHGFAEEVELRACAVHAIELLSAATGQRLAPYEIDAILWTRGRAPHYKSVPRPRSRNTAY